MGCRSSASRDVPAGPAGAAGRRARRPVGLRTLRSGRPRGLRRCDRRQRARPCTSQAGRGRPASRDRASRVAPPPCARRPATVARLGHGHPDRGQRRRGRAEIGRLDSAAGTVAEHQGRTAHPSRRVVRTRASPRRVGLSAVASSIGSKRVSSTSTRLDQVGPVRSNVADGGGDRVRDRAGRATGTSSAVSTSGSVVRRVEPLAVPLRLDEQRHPIVQVTEPRPSAWVVHDRAGVDAVRQTS